ncbi:MAG: hypothetical protein DRP99_05030, partial [Candidatus Latescibacterota bacterium]
DDYFGGKTINDTITIPDALKIRVHFSHIGAYSYIEIYEKNNPVPIEIFDRPLSDITNNWTKWCDGDTVRIESQSAEFSVDRYEALLANVSFSLDARKHTNHSAVLNLSMQEMGWALNGTHNITVVVDPYDEIDEPDEENNINTTRITVTPSLDFAVTDISFEPEEPVLNDNIEIKANITNLGNRSGETFVEVYYDNRTVELERKISGVGSSTDVISLPPGVTGARLHFKRVQVGSHGSIRIYDENGNLVGYIKEKGWTDYIYSKNITIESKCNLATESVAFKIDKYEALILNKRVALNASKSKNVTASWNATTLYGGAGHHNITVRIDPHDVFTEKNETNNTLTRQIFVNGTDLAVTNIDIPCGIDNNCYRGQDINITVMIVNFGAIDAHNLTVFFHDGVSPNHTVNTSGIADVFYPSEIFVPHFRSGESKRFNVTWTPADFGIHTITVNVSFVPLVDNNKTNNELIEFPVSVETELDFSIENVSVYPEEVKEGEPVNINVTVGNLGRVSGNVSVGFFTNRTDFAGSEGERFVRIGTTEPVYVESGGKNTTSFMWNASTHGGDHLIVAVADPDNDWVELKETKKRGDASIAFRGNDTGNNVKTCTLHIIGPDLNIINLSLDPAEPNIGDIVNITAEIKNNENTTANSTLWFYMYESISVQKLPWSLLQPEDVTMRVHFAYINISEGDEVNAYISDTKGRHPVCFYVEYGGGANAQAIKVFNISFNTTGWCAGYNESGIETENESEIVKKRWENVWTDWCNDKKLEITGRASDLYIDEYQFLLGKKTVMLKPGESKLCNLSWNASFPLEAKAAGKNYTFMAFVEGKKKEKETYLGGTDLAVTNISIEPVVEKIENEITVLDGNLVRVNATIKNFGSMNASDFNVSIYEVAPSFTHFVELFGYYSCIHYKSLGTKHVKELPAGSSVSLSLPWNASIRDILFNCTSDNFYHPYIHAWKSECNNYKIKVTIDPNENYEQNETNNYDDDTKVHVKPSRDFFIANLSFTVNNETIKPDYSGNSSKVWLNLYDNVTLNATLDIIN